ncbi:MAG: hypothetical protein MRERV_12c008 [Mycoplasmataceae bacterium RV_VA103A]|nr:MAG: hypothetical protein MRERV_12c008 [Mycoplasmataceae bacterium RV_VA103A]
MPEPFRLDKKEFSQIYQEWQWTYLCLFDFAFNYRTITKITITDHPWRKKGREGITQELILNICREHLNGELKRPKKRHGNREVFIEEEVPYQDKNYLLVFWFEDDNSDWLWVRNCYPIS